MKISNQTPREPPAVEVHEVRVEMASAAQVHSWLGAVEARSFKGSSVHYCTRTMSTLEGGRSRTVQHVLLEMVSNVGEVLLLIQACSGLESYLPCTLWRSSPPRCSDSTYAAGTITTCLLLNVVVAAVVIFHSGTAVDEVVEFSCPKDHNNTDADFAAATAPVRSDVVEDAVGAAAALVTSVVDDDAVAAGDCDLDHSRCGFQCACRRSLTRWFHF